MKISVEISYYPLKEEYLKPIETFIERLQSHKDLFIRVNGMSTQVAGQYDEVMGILQKEIKTALELPHSIFVLKILNMDLREVEN
ncbi:MAG: hypothetical protein U5L09_07000 [Bacteroidales bacterium]|nr:hypothetical protein [Bacteroidales bacterium]